MSSSGDGDREAKRKRLEKEAKMKQPMINDPRDAVSLPPLAPFQGGIHISENSLQLQPPQHHPQLSRRQLINAVSQSQPAAANIISPPTETPNPSASDTASSTEANSAASTFADALTNISNEMLSSDDEIDMEFNDIPAEKVDGLVKDLMMDLMMNPMPLKTEQQQQYQPLFIDHHEASSPGQTSNSKASDAVSVAEFPGTASSFFAGSNNDSSLQLPPPSHLGSSGMAASQDRQRALTILDLTNDVYWGVMPFVSPRKSGHEYWRRTSFDADEIEFADQLLIGEKSPRQSVEQQPVAPTEQSQPPPSGTAGTAIQGQVQDQSGGDSVTDKQGCADDLNSPHPPPN